MAEKYSLWILPTDKLKSSLEDVIKKLAKKYNSSLFEPHLTLIGGFNSSLNEIKQGTKKLAYLIKPFIIKTGEISFSTTYYQNVFLRVKSSACLMDVNLKAKKIFKLENDIFMPHISLLYGNQSLKIREQAVSRIKIPEAKFIADKIIVVPSIPDPKEWKHLVEYNLSS
ncbi:hypothetical protein A3J78_01495 [Candidatus Beckwithbacteria bacterium RBG_13_35_6]|uniref:Cyclic phosphodiesterase-like protein n=1 Tax=Candidatus Beckwithbacteria bacterium RBG_13_35_6 TaxID=1797456 RepID=A0A1F5DHN6_9BACT|nr:MAG: hypothetical protein A3J78_01495 [Candidatus Beckwithbacteria bacterium RBG_13_35_6]